MIGNAHIDPVWLWQWPEGYQEARATFQSAVDRLEFDPGGHLREPAGDPVAELEQQRKRGGHDHRAALVGRERGRARRLRG